MNIVLVCIKNFQEYILSNIEQLLRLNHKNIYVLTNKCFFDRFVQFNDRITLVNIDNLIDTYDYYSKTNLNKGFRNGFWPLASLRFFYIYEFMRRFNVNDVIHLENDVLIYYNCDEIMSKFDKRFMYIPFDTLNRNIASIIYIPTADIFKNVLDNYDNDVSDMYVFNFIQKKTGLIQNLPIFIYDTSVIPEISFVSQNYDNFKFIFDAAAMGQFLGGVDPQNIDGDTCGFVNKTCIIKYNNYEFDWIIINDVKKPFIKINEQMIPIFNLHIHCKNLKQFM
jgi:hypothetical protein